MPAESTPATTRTYDQVVEGLGELASRAIDEATRIAGRSSVSRDELGRLGAALSALAHDAATVHAMHAVARQAERAHRDAPGFCPRCGNLQLERTVKMEVNLSADSLEEAAVDRRWFTCMDCGWRGVAPLLAPVRLASTETPS